MSKSISWMRNKAVMVGSAAILTVAMLALPGMGVVKAATPVHATVTIKTTVMDGGTLVNAQAVTVTDIDNPTLKDALDVVNGPNADKIIMEETGYGYYVSAVKVDGHSSTNKFFDDNGTASDDTIATNDDYEFKDDVDGIDAPAFIDTLYGTSNFWTNTIATANYLTEKDYNYNSGWMVELNNDNYANWGLGTTLNEGDNIVLEFTMFGGADLGATAYVLDETATSPSSGPWVAVSPF